MILSRFSTVDARKRFREQLSMVFRFNALFSEVFMLKTRRHSTCLIATDRRSDLEQILHKPRYTKSNFCIFFQSIVGTFAHSLENTGMSNFVLKNSVKLPIYNHMDGFSSHAG